MFLQRWHYFRFLTLFENVRNNSEILKKDTNLKVLPCVCTNCNWMVWSSEQNFDMGHKFANIPLLQPLKKQQKMDLISAQKLWIVSIVCIMNIYTSYQQCGRLLQEFVIKGRQQISCTTSAACMVCVSKNCGNTTNVLLQFCLMFGLF